MIQSKKETRQSKTLKLVLRVAMLMMNTNNKAENLTLEGKRVCHFLLGRETFYNTTPPESCKEEYGH